MQPEELLVILYFTDSSNDDDRERDAKMIMARMMNLEPYSK